MSKLPDGTNPYGRLLDLMRNASDTPRGIDLGEYIGGGKFTVGSQTLEKGDYFLIQNSITIGGTEFKLPCLEEQNADIEVGEETFSVSVPALKAGDTVAAYQLGNEEYIIFGKVVE